MHRCRVCAAGVIEAKTIARCVRASTELPEAKRNQARALLAMKIASHPPSPPKRKAALLAVETIRLCYAQLAQESEQVLLGTVQVQSTLAMALDVFWEVSRDAVL